MIHLSYNKTGPSRGVPSRRVRLPLASKSAFTLIELLTVIAIIAVLAAILFPVFAQAKESAKKANCISNLKQMSLAFVLYAGDYDDTLPQTNYDIPGTTLRRYWYYEVDKPTREYDFSKGILSPYTKAHQLSDCRSADGLGQTTSQYVPSPISYGMNQRLAQLNMSDIEAPAETMGLGDSAYYTPSHGYAYRYFIIVSMYYNAPAMHGRHTGNQSVVGWADGHAKAYRVQFRNYGRSPSAPASEYEGWLYYRLGDILKGPRKQLTSPGGFGTNTPEQCEDFYYHLIRKSWDSAGICY